MNAINRGVEVEVERKRRVEGTGVIGLRLKWRRRLCLVKKDVSIMSSIRINMEGGNTLFLSDAAERWERDGGIIIRHLRSGTKGVWYAKGAL
jgi:hypothetical protein